MKKILFLLAITAVANGVFAQDSSKTRQDSDMPKAKYMKKDCYLMKDSLMMVVRHGDTTSMKQMDKSVTLNNGTTIMTDGTVKMTDGTTKLLKEGWYIDEDGKIDRMRQIALADKM